MSKVKTKKKCRKLWSELGISLAKFNAYKRRINSVLEQTLSEQDISALW